MASGRQTTVRCKNKSSYTHGCRELPFLARLSCLKTKRRYDMFHGRTYGPKYRITGLTIYWASSRWTVLWTFSAQWALGWRTVVAFFHNDRCTSTASVLGRLVYL